jgi:hypothetical protein
MKRDRNESPQNATLEPLTPAQETAIAALLAGRTVTNAAEAAGVDRATVHRWLREHFGFQAAVNAGRRELREGVHTRLERLAEKAAGCVEKAIDGGDVKAALEILKGLQVLAPTSIGSEDPEQLAKEADISARERQGEIQHRARVAQLMSM